MAKASSVKFCYKGAIRPLSPLFFFQRARALSLFLSSQPCKTSSTSSLFPTKAKAALAKSSPLLSWSKTTTISYLLFSPESMVQSANAAGLKRIMILIFVLLIKINSFIIKNYSFPLFQNYDLHRPHLQRQWPLLWGHSNELSSCSF